MTRLRLLAFILMTPFLFAGCTREERSLNVQAQFSIVRENGATAAMRMEGRLYDAHMDRASFDQAWSAVTRVTAPYEALALTLQSVGADEPVAVPLLAGLVLAVPLPLREGRSYAIGAAFPPPAEQMPMYWGVWGARDLVTPQTAEIALRTFDYHTVGMRIENEFVATAASGVIEVLDVGDDRVELRLDLRASDAAGRQVRLQGDFSVSAERYRPPIT